MEYDEIDLRPYLLGIARRWKWIVAGALLAALAAGLGSLLLAPTYTANTSALLFIRQTTSQAGLNQPLLTIESIDVVARRRGLVALAQNSAIEADLPREVVEQLAPADYRPGELAKRITASTEGDLLTIVAAGRSAEQAKLLADSWMTAYTARVKLLYTDQHSSVQPTGSALLPPRPNRRHVLRNAGLAGLAGALLAIVAALAQQALAVPRLERRPGAAPERAGAL